MDTPTPKIGMGITYQVGSDRYAGTITRVSDGGARFWFRDDRQVLREGGAFTERQTYLYVPGDGNEQVAYRNRNGRWRVQGKGFWITLDVRRANRDPSF